MSDPPPFLRELNPPWTNPLKFYNAALKKNLKKLHKKGERKSKGVLHFSVE
jgi:hypothetical protein